MTQQETEEYNKRCALFMKLELLGPGFPAGYWFKDKFYQFHELMFHSNWDWIIEGIVKKIESTHDDFHGYFAVSIYSNSCTIQVTNLRTGTKNPVHAYYNECKGRTKMETTVEAVNNFLIWYNLNLLIKD